MAAIYLTRQGYERLFAELNELLTVRRPQVMSDLTLAREFGDLRENAEYEVAKRDQGIIEGRIRELEDLLASVEIIEIPPEVDAAVLGARLIIENLDSGQRRDCILVSEQEAHLADQYLSVESPLGRSLLGGKVGQIIDFDAPAGIRRFRIVELHGCPAEEEEIGA